MSILIADQTTIDSTDDHQFSGVTYRTLDGTVLGRVVPVLAPTPGVTINGQSLDTVTTVVGFCEWDDCDVIAYTDAIRIEIAGGFAGDAVPTPGGFTYEMNSAIAEMMREVAA